MVKENMELVVEVFGMVSDGQGGHRISEGRHEEPQSFDILVRPDGGDPIEEFEGLDETQLQEYLALVERTYPEAPVTHIPN